MFQEKGGVMEETVGLLGGSDGAHVSFENMNPSGEYLKDNEGQNGKSNRVKESFKLTLVLCIFYVTFTRHLMS